MSAPEFRRLPGASLVEVAALRGQAATTLAALEAVAESGLDRLAIAPARWLLISAAPGLAATLAPALVGRAAVVDQSGGLVRFTLQGPGSETALTRGCRLDLHPARFAAGQVARTIVAQIPATLFKRDATPRFDIFVPATFAHSFAHALAAMADAARIDRQESAS